MAIQQKPVVGNWYVNLTGQLLKICAVSYEAGAISKVVIEFLSGKKLILDLDKWNLLDLETYIYKSSSLINQQN
jgi:hypothetical protein